ncbi:DNA-directed RNA polymerase I subunit RPA12-like isoform X2 [Ostrea edulis]|uniref:DNA-directed RNA polymerase I subunit RPA12-like isoform X2 n=1 Tax=Ostrea edulis TaxID=37623 RepID=UPI002095CDE6|nr:DNA-directed RNA polymerase I subunit RPA12-like isoform X2 [Ostrea edulis]
MFTVCDTRAVIMSKKSSTFVTDLEFCPTCGTILPLPGIEDFVTCKLCGFKINVREFDGVNIVSSIVFNRPETLQTSNEDGESPVGPLADRKCSKCGNEKMIYTTRQTRSADEGQTVFFTCPNCNSQEIEYS